MLLANLIHDFMALNVYVTKELGHKKSASECLLLLFSFFTSATPRPSRD